MNRKIRSTLGLIGLLIVILLAGGGYIFFGQRSSINNKNKKLAELNKSVYDPQQLASQFNDLSKRAAVLDSILASRKFNIPQNLSSIKFFVFINQVTSNFDPLSNVDVEYIDQKPDKEFFYHSYKITGKATYNDLYSLIYSIEESKELKKITSLNLSNVVATDDKGMPEFLVNFVMEAHVYFASNDRFATAEFVENNLSTQPIYDAFYPLIRNQIPPNVDNLLDVQGAKLLALIPEGAFISDSKGNTYLVWEGEKVYLGYVTKIDYDHNQVSFILNKGGIIEKTDLELQKEDKTKQQ